MSTSVAAPHSTPAEANEPSQKPWLQLIFVLGEAVLQVISSGILFVIISRVAGPALLGTYALAYAWLTLLQGIASAGIPEFLLREVGIYGQAAAKHVAHAILLGLGTGVIGVFLMQAGVRVLGYSPYLIDVISIASIALIPAFLNSAARSVFLTLRKMHLNFIAVAAETTIVMIVSLYVLFSGYGAIGLMVTLVAGKFVSATLSMIMLYSRALPLRVAFDRAFLVRMARTVFTFSVLNMLALVTKRINTIMVSVWAGIETVGHYAAATKIVELGLIPGDLFAQLLMTRIAYSFNTQASSAAPRDPNRFGHWYQLMFALIVPACIGVWVFADVILETLFGSAFGSAFWILRLLMIYLLVETADNIMSVILQADHRQREDANRLAFNPVTNIVLNLVLLPAVGAIGAAIGRVGGVLASTALRQRLMTRELAAVNWLRFLVKPGLIGAAVAAVCYALGDVARHIWLLGLYVGATGVLLLVTSTFSIPALKDLMSSPTSKELAPVDPMAMPPSPSGIITEPN